MSLKDCGAIDFACLEPLLTSCSASWPASHQGPTVGRSAMLGARKGSSKSCSAAPEPCKNQRNTTETAPKGLRAASESLRKASEKMLISRIYRTYRGYMIISYRT